MESCGCQQKESLITDFRKDRGWKESLETFHSFLEAREEGASLDQVPVSNYPAGLPSLAGGREERKKELTHRTHSANLDSTSSPLQSWMLSKSPVPGCPEAKFLEWLRFFQNFRECGAVRRNPTMPHPTPDKQSLRQTTHDKCDLHFPLCFSSIF
jgi:hypothetical protein